LLIPNFALGNTRPIDLLKDSYGKEMVVAELTRVAHGIFFRLHHLQNYLAIDLSWEKSQLY